jgi:hypothetical protein
MSLVLSGFLGLFVRDRFKSRRSGGFPAFVPVPPGRKKATVRSAQGIEAEYHRAGFARPVILERKARSGPGRMRPKGEDKNSPAFFPAGNRALFLS